MNTPRSNAAQQPTRVAFRTAACDFTQFRIADVTAAENGVRSAFLCAMLASNPPLITLDQLDASPPKPGNASNASTERYDLYAVNGVVHRLTVTAPLLNADPSHACFTYGADYIYQLSPATTLGGRVETMVQLITKSAPDGSLHKAIVHVDRVETTTWALGSEAALPAWISNPKLLLDTACRTVASYSSSIDHIAPAWEREAAHAECTVATEHTGIALRAIVNSLSQHGRTRALAGDAERLQHEIEAKHAELERVNARHDAALATLKQKITTLRASLATETTHAASLEAKLRVAQTPPPPPAVDVNQLPLVIDLRRRLADSEARAKDLRNTLRTSTTRYPRPA
ncbi:MAG TPA: hypothetical protein VFQ88_15245 [Nevskiaceae bacterium]|nr:hypothetical protein [Nevskiaceae bacterium]